MEVVLVVAGCIIEDRKILVGLRKHSKSPETIGMWEMMGGKVEKGETPREALTRELEEELGFVVSVGDLLHAQINTYSAGITYLVLFYYCGRLSISGKGEGIETRWVYPRSKEFLNTLPGANEALNALISRGGY